MPKFVNSIAVASRGICHAILIGKVTKTFGASGFSRRTSFLLPTCPTTDPPGAAQCDPSSVRRSSCAVFNGCVRLQRLTGEDSVTFSRSRDEIVFADSHGNVARVRAVEDHNLWPVPWQTPVALLYDGKNPV